MSAEQQDALLQQAGSLANSGNFIEARKILSEILDGAPDHIDALGMLGNIDKANGDIETAIHGFTQIVSLQPHNPWPRYDLAEAIILTGEPQKAALHYLKAWELDNSNARYLLAAGNAYWQAGDHNIALQIWSLASDRDPVVRTAYHMEQADNETKQRSQLADTELRRHFTQLSESGMKKHGNPKRLRSAVWPQTHFGNVAYTSDTQKPFMFFAADLPQTPVFNNNQIDWAQPIEAGANDIYTELHAYLKASQDEGQPYVDHNDSLSDAWKKLNEKDGWNAIHLYKNAKAKDCLLHFPKTTKILESVPLVEIFGTPMEVFFSILKPNAHIPPHFGLSNSRCTAHLPLVVPDNCEIRVAEHVHQWQEGELFLFDDSFNHEAINKSDDVRIVLIFETWRPDLSENEIEALQQTMEDRHTWLSKCEIPLSNIE